MRRISHFVVRDSVRNGLDNEVKESGFFDVRKYSICHGVLQTVIGVKSTQK